MSNTTPLEHIEVAPNSAVSATVIWLHGLGADGHDFEGIVPSLRLDPTLAVRFIFPHAPIQPVTINGGMRMRAWYDVAHLDFAAEPDMDGIHASRSSLTQLIQKETARGIPSQRIVLAGFSQGGVIALETGLDYDKPLAGIIALSTYFASHLNTAWQPAAANAQTPILMCHGTADQVVPHELGERSRDFLNQHGCHVEWRDYTMPHTVCVEEINHISDWLNRVLS